MLLKTQQVAALRRPSNRDWRSLKTWMLSNAPVVRSEQQFLFSKNDLVSLGSGWQGAGFEVSLETMISRLDRFLRIYLDCNAVSVRLPSPTIFMSLTRDIAPVCHFQELIARIRLL